ncbi:hypothetical protein [Treponema phagedenis]|nr:hypothetical protein [Treponema phagedenis]NVP24021.1 hypothetical protein [Treponema phagedenis]QEJ99813.1 hypothetical protein FUT84_00540 [Treponema phagedenis]QEK07258.1 hypothetical protein FUT80_11385 [Treponema phagedenis]
MRCVRFFCFTTSFQVKNTVGIMALVPQDMEARNYYLGDTNKDRQGNRKLKNLKTSRFSKALTITT